MKTKTKINENVTTINDVTNETTVKRDYSNYIWNNIWLPKSAIVASSEKNSAKLIQIAPDTQVWVKDKYVRYNDVTEKYGIGILSHWNYNVNVLTDDKTMTYEKSEMSGAEISSVYINNLQVVK